MSAVAVLDDVIGDAATGIKSTIQASVSGVNAFLSTTLGGFNDVLKLIGQHIDVPTVAQPDLRSVPQHALEGLCVLITSRSAL
jgi:hypothetical protein